MPRSATSQNPQRNEQRQRRRSAYRDSGLVLWPYVFVVAGRFGGFALVDKRVRIAGDDFWMDQFFVLKKYRRRGIGTAAAATVFDRHPGRWQVGQMPENHAAQAFWRRAIGAYAAGRFTEEQLAAGWWQGWVQRFTSPGLR